MSFAYRKIEQFYGDQKAERSQVPLINHIKEGLAILDYLEATQEAKDAFCLHPMFQADDDLKRNWFLLTKYPGHTVMLVMEYRNKANAWLSDKVEDHSVYSYSDKEPQLVRACYRPIGRPDPGPLREVEAMLIADKVQNYKDFLLYHDGKHERSQELRVYFQEWLKALYIGPTLYEKLVEVAKEATK